MMQPKNNGRATLFSNPYLEWLTKSHPLIIWGFYLPVIAYCLYVASSILPFWVLVAVFFFAVLTWTLFEYLAHRFLFHWVSNRVRSKKFIYIIHGNHHEFPRDRQRLFMPLVPSLVISSSLFGVQFLVLGKVVYAFFPGFMLGYLLYASTHYAIHAWDPPFAFMRPLWRNHLMHHYQDEHLGFGVSNSFWDRVFKTGFDKHRFKEDHEKEKLLKF
jgi:sterol desaturase/sphingolipid hydroxylase (fatty acid hydroxylase superfamily)